MKEYNWIRTVLVLVIPVLFGFGPCGPLAGGMLSGSVVTKKIDNFEFVESVDNCKLEVKAAEPHSVTLNCWTVGKQLFVGCKDCDGKKWSSYVADNPLARIKIGGEIYPVKLTRMSDQFAIERAWKYRWNKYGEGELENLPTGYWLYHLRSYAEKG
ncbi:MAG: hypothetical protein ACI9FB_004301 [Candidatus Azotimanducaceae bacterium]|jgi:hypothetical protein